MSLASTGRVWEAWERHARSFVGPGHFYDLVAFAGEARCGVEVVEAGEYLLLYPRGRERGTGLGVAEWLVRTGVEEVEHVGRVLERVRCREEWCDLFREAPGGLAGVAGVDRESGRVFFHPLPPQLAAVLHLLPPGSLGDEEVVRELLGFDLNPWESPAAAGGDGWVRLRVQGDLVLDVHPIERDGFELFLSLAAAVSRAPRLALEALARAVEALAALPDGMPVDRLASVAGEVVAAALSHAVPCLRGVPVRASQPLPSLTVVEVAVEGMRVDGECMERELVRAAGASEQGVMMAYILRGHAGPNSLRNTLEHPPLLFDPLLKGHRGTLATAAAAAAAQCPAAPEWAGGRLLDGWLVAAARRPGGGVVVVRFGGAGLLHDTAHVVEALRVRVRLAAGDARLVEEALGGHALAGPLRVNIGRHRLELDEASLVPLHPAVAWLTRYSTLYGAVFEARRALEELLPPGSARDGERLLDNAWSNPEAAKRLVTALARLYHHSSPPPREAIVATRPQTLVAYHSEHGEARILLPRPLIAIPRFIPRARLPRPAREDGGPGEDWEEPDAWEDYWGDDGDGEE